MIRLLRFRAPLLAVLVPVTMAATPAAAQDASAAETPPESSTAPAATARYDLLFREMMEGLPAESRSKVDSAGNVAASPVEGPLGPGGELPGEGEAARRSALEKLSGEVRERVEKAITEIENRRREREIEFKELH